MTYELYTITYTIILLQISNPHSTGFGLNPILSGIVRFFKTKEYVPDLTLLKAELVSSSSYSSVCCSINCKPTLPWLIRGNNAQILVSFAKPAARQFYTIITTLYYRNTKMGFQLWLEGLD